LLLRTVPNAGGNVVNGRIVLDVAFQPRRELDEDGLSLFRLDFITPEQLAKANAHRAGVYCVFLHAARLLEMPMTLLPVFDELPGHVVIPEITYSAYKAEDTKQLVKDRMIYLRLQANRSTLWGPSDPPTDAVSN